MRNQITAQAVTVDNIGPCRKVIMPCSHTNDVLRECSVIACLLYEEHSNVNGQIWFSGVPS